MKKLIVKWVHKTPSKDVIDPKIPKEGEEVYIYTDSGNNANYCNVKGYEFDAVGEKIEFRINNFREPSFTNALTKELAEDFIEKDKKVREVENEKIFSLTEEF